MGGNDLVVTPSHLPKGVIWATAPLTFANAGDKAVNRLLEFFTAEINNPNTRASYGRAVGRFDRWCVQNQLALHELTPVHVAAYIEELGKPTEPETPLAKPSIKQHLAALRMLFDYLVIGQVIPFNPATSVRGPKYVIKKGKTPVLTGSEAKKLFASIETDTMIGLRDRALIGVMAYGFARISAVLSMNVGDFYQQGTQYTVRLHEKGGKEHEVPAHHTLVEMLDAYLTVANIKDAKSSPLFRSFNRKQDLSNDRLTRREALAMIKRRALATGLGDRICNHTFRATGITNFLENDGTIEKAMQIAAHESPRTTKLYDRRDDRLHLDEIEKIRF
jgi:integrase/recombinase XerD